MQGRQDRVQGRRLVGQAGGFGGRGVSVWIGPAGTRLCGAVSERARMADEWGFMKGRQFLVSNSIGSAGFDGYAGGPNVVASSSSLPFSSLQGSNLPPSEATVASPGSSTRDSGRFSCPRQTSQSPAGSSLEVEGGRHPYLPPVAPSGPSTSTYTTLTCLDRKSEGGPGCGQQEEAVEEMRGRRERLTTR